LIFERGTRKEGEKEEKTEVVLETSVENIYIFWVEGAVVGA